MRKLKLHLPPNQEAFIDADGKVSIHSTDIRSKDNYGVVSVMRSVERRFLYKEPTLQKCDADYLMKEGAPRQYDRESGLCIY